MQQQTKLILLFMFLWLVQKSQGQNSKQAENTILKIDQDQNPYSKRQTNWFGENGFDTESYSWDSQEINLLLSEAIGFHRKSHVKGWISAGVFLSALLVNGVVSIAESTNGGSMEDNSARLMMNSLYVGGAGLAITSIVFTIKAKEKAVDASKLRNSNRLKIY